MIRNIQKITNFIAAICLTMMLGTTAFGQVVIHEVYGGGGNAGAPFTNDFVELFNQSSAPIDLTGYVVAYASAAGTFQTGGQVTLTGTIPARGFYLIQFGSGGAVGAALPTPDNANTTNLSGTNGNVILVLPTFAGIGTNFACPAVGAAGVVDRVGYGTGACPETTAAPAASNTTSVNRAFGIDSNDNSADFTTAAPTPQNTVAPTAGEVFVGGRVLDNRGFPIVNAVVTLSGGPLTQPRTFTTGGFGYFGFKNVSVGNTYVISVMSDRYSFDQPAQVVALNDEKNDLMFTGTRFFGSSRKK